MFHQINELMVLGMHSLSPYLRRNRSAPIRGITSPAKAGHYLLSHVLQSPACTSCTSSAAPTELCTPDTHVIPSGAPEPIMQDAAPNTPRGAFRFHLCIGKSAIRRARR